MGVQRRLTAADCRGRVAAGAGWLLPGGYSGGPALGSSFGHKGDPASHAEARSAKVNVPLCILRNLPKIRVQFREMPLRYGRNYLPSRSLPLAHRPKIQWRSTYARGRYRSRIALKLRTCTVAPYALRSRSLPLARRFKIRVQVLRSFLPVLLGRVGVGLRVGHAQQVPEPPRIFF